MGQTANSIHIFVRKGGYEPSASLHVDSTVNTVAQGLNPVILAFRGLIPTDVTVQRAELQDPQGNIIEESNITLQGLWDGVWQAFTQCTRFTWISDGPSKPSGQFVHPLPYNAFIFGSPTVGWGAAVADYVDAIQSGPYTDSEGFKITGVKRYYPSRRPNVRVAP